jgi:hypothetical protein
MPTYAEIEQKLAQAKRTHKCNAPDVYVEYEAADGSLAVGNDVRVKAIIKCRNGDLRPIILTPII